MFYDGKKTILNCPKNQTLFLGAFFSTLLFINLAFNAASLYAEDIRHVEFSGDIVFTAPDNQIKVTQGEDNKIISLTETGRNFWPQWSPDGAKIAFASVRGNHKNFEIYIMDADGKNQNRLTYTNNGSSTEPHWSSDGNAIYFSSAIQGNMQENIIEMAIDKKKTLKSAGTSHDVSPIKDSKELERPAKGETKSDKKLRERLEKSKGLFRTFPSPDGRYLLLYYGNEKKIILVDNVKGAQKELKTRQYESGAPSWSKDSKKAAYMKYITPKNILLIHDIRRGSYKEFLLDKEADVRCGGELSWSPDSKKLVYSCAPVNSAAHEGESKSWLYIFDLKTRQSMKLVQGSSPDWH